MDCEGIDRILVAPSRMPASGLPQGAQWHVANCPRCRELLSVLDFDPEFELSQDVLQRMEAPILGSLKPVARLSPAGVFIALFAMTFLALTALGVYRLGSNGWEALPAFQKTVIFISLAASAGLLSFSSVLQMMPGHKQYFSPALLPLGVSVLILLAIAGGFQYERDPHFVRDGMNCITAGLPYALPAAILFSLLLWRGAVMHPRVAGATAGMLAGLVGTSILEVHCTNRDVWHIVLWHFGICVIGCITGLLAGALGAMMQRRFDAAYARNLVNGHAEKTTLRGAY